ncbi:MAG: hypothetical protein WA459_12280 [Stellaceae bacterium]
MCPIWRRRGGGRGRADKRGTTIAIAGKPEESRPVEACLVELLDDLGIGAAHFAGRGGGDLKGFAARYRDRIASLTLLCPAVLDNATLAPLAGRLLVVTGDHGPGPRRVRAGLAELPHATTVVLEDYAGQTWADIALERGERIGRAMLEFLGRRGALPAAGLPEQEGDSSGISYRVRGAGAPLVLLPLDLSPGQWERLIPVLSTRYCTITLGGALVGSVASLEERGRSGYMGVVRGLLDALANHARRERPRSRMRLGGHHARAGAAHARGKPPDRP